MKPYLVPHVGSYELETFWKWLQTPESERKDAVLNWTSGFVRQLGYLIEKHYEQKKDRPEAIDYKNIFIGKPFMSSFEDGSETKAESMEKLSPRITTRMTQL